MIHRIIKKQTEIRRDKPDRKKMTYELKFIDSMR